MLTIKRYGGAALACCLVFAGGTAIADSQAPAQGPAPAQGAAAALPAGTYRLDKSHSTLTFKVNHLGFSFYTASFPRLDAVLEINPDDPEAASLTATIDSGALVLPAPPEGFHEELTGPRWLNAAAFPEITYRSTAIRKGGGNTARITGDLTLNGHTRPVTMQVTFNGGYPGLEGLDPQARIGFSAQGHLNRSDFGITAGIPAEGSMMGVGDRVEFLIEAEFTGPPLAATGKAIQTRSGKGR